jgi:hypothetical protein
MMEHSVTYVVCLQRRTETNGPLAVRQRGTGTVADLLGANYDEPLKMELNTV